MRPLRLADGPVPTVPPRAWATSIKDELPKLADRHRRVVSVFTDRGLQITDEDGCVELLRDVKVRADFIAKLKKFLETLDVVLPRREALPYTKDARRLGFINKSAANLYRDSQLNLVGAGPKVARDVQPGDRNRRFDSSRGHFEPPSCVEPAWLRGSGVS